MPSRFAIGQLVRVVRDFDNGPTSPFIGIVSHIVAGPVERLESLQGHVIEGGYILAAFAPNNLCARACELEPIDDDSRDKTKWDDSIFKPTEAEENV